MSDCIFCKIVAGEIPAAKVYEDEDFLAFLDINPVNFGHTLVIPKKHYENILATPDEVVFQAFLVVKKIMPAIKDSLAADFVAVSIVGIDVPHFHIHLIPRYLNDGLENFWPTKKYPADEIEKVARKIKEVLDDKN